MNMGVDDRYVLHWTVNFADGTETDFEQRRHMELDDALLAIGQMLKQSKTATSFVVVIVNVNRELEAKAA
jgi:hypothetical protein